MWDERDPLDYAKDIEKMATSMARRGMYQTAQILNGAAEWLMRLDEVEKSTQRSKDVAKPD